MIFKYPINKINIDHIVAFQDVRIGVGRHRDKLEQIRDSLRPFEQTGNMEASTAAATSSSSSPNNYNNNNNSNNNNNFTVEDETRRQILINTLTQIGFEEVIIV